MLHGLTTAVIATVKQQFLDSGAARATQEKIAFYTEKAFEALDRLKVSEDKKQLLKTFGTSLMERTV